MSGGSIISLEFPESDVAVLSLNDPNKGANVLSQSVMTDLSAQLDDLEQRDDLAGVVIRSTKPGAFIAGADLREFVANLGAPAEEIVDISRRGQDLLARLSQAPFVTVAAIDGACLGGGGEVAVWCDRRVVTDNPKTVLGFPEVKIGVFPGWGGIARLPRMIGLSNAVEMIAGGDGVPVAELVGMGLADDVVASKGGETIAERLLAAAIRMIRAEQKQKDFLADRQRWAAPIEMSDTEMAFLGATANAYIQQQTKGHYPAPLAALEVMLGSAGVDVATACKMESEGFAQLFGSPVNRALLNVFFLQDANKKQTGVSSDAKPAKVNTATVIGAGIMGQGIAAANVKRGVPVSLGDMNAEAVGRGVQGVLSEVSFNRQTKGPDAEKALQATPLINGTVSDAELTQADIVVEAIFENLEAKRALYERLEPQMPAHAVLCSNTSTIPITKLAAELQRPESFCGLHFFNPVRRMPLVEVIRGDKTSDATIATAVAYAKRIGKSPIVCNDGPGFIVNRILLPYMNEALLLLEEGASIKAVDRAAKKFGMPMGPIELYDTVGLDVAVHAGRVMVDAFPDRVEESGILPAMFEAKRLGQKNGRGFFDYDNPKKRNRGSESQETAAIIEKHRRDNQEFSTSQIIDRLILPMVVEAARILEDDVAHSAQDVDLALIYGIGFPPFQGGLLFWADQQGIDQIVEKLGAYADLGKRYQPPEMLSELASSGSTFYAASTT